VLQDCRKRITGTLDPTFVLLFLALVVAAAIRVSDLSVAIASFHYAIILLRIIDLVLLLTSDRQDAVLERNCWEVPDPRRHTTLLVDAHVPAVP
jgi:hypothetical protein